jgi:hypothetical protein
MADPGQREEVKGLSEPERVSVWGYILDQVSMPDGDEVAKGSQAGFTEAQYVRMLSVQHSSLKEKEVLNHGLRYWGALVLKEEVLAELDTRDSLVPRQGRQVGSLEGSKLQRLMAALRWIQDGFVEPGQLEGEHALQTEKVGEKGGQDSSAKRLAMANEARSTKARLEVCSLLDELLAEGAMCGPYAPYLQVQGLSSNGIAVPKKFAKE